MPTVLKIHFGSFLIKFFVVFRKSPGRAPINRSISADPNMNDPEIQAKIGNRMTKTVEKSIGEYSRMSRDLNWSTQNKLKVLHI